MAHVVHQAPGRGHDNVDARAQRALLNVHRDAAVHRHAGDGGVIGQSLNLVFDLDGQLPRRRQHERPGRRRTGRKGIEKPLKDRDEKRGGLAGPRLRARDDIIAGQRQRDDATLHRARRVPSKVADTAQETRVEAEALERDRRRVERRRLVGERGRPRADVDLRSRGRTWPASAGRASAVV